jgi:hypothetical protein
MAALGARADAVVGPPREGQTMTDRLNAVEKTIKSVMATAAAIGALYTGIKAGCHRPGSAFAAAQDVAVLLADAE